MALLTNTGYYLRIGKTFKLLLKGLQGEGCVV